MTRLQIVAARWKPRAASLDEPRPQFDGRVGAGVLG
jgi:hypothetical protein